MIIIHDHHHPTRLAMRLVSHPPQTDPNDELLRLISQGADVVKRRVRNKHYIN
jgi:hypothetical protein